MADYELKLYLAGKGAQSSECEQRILDLLEGVLCGRYTLEVIDVLTSPSQAESDDVIATPTLLIRTPAPERRIIGRLTESRKVLEVLGLPQEASKTA
jgi:circadian clock protein KaiB